MTYNSDLEEIKTACLQEGITQREWDAWMLATNFTLRTLGFASGADVRRIALQHGHFEHHRRCA